MSRKIDAFRLALPHPLTKKDVTLLSTDLAEGALLAQAMSIPSETMNEVTYYYKGRPMYAPTRTTVTGTWTVDFPDSIYTPIRYHLEYLLYNRTRFNVTLILGDLRDVLGGVLSGNILSSLSSLSATAVAALTSARTLCDCWLKEIAPVDMSMQGATEPVIWRATIRYNYIKPFINLL